MLRENSPGIVATGLYCPITNMKSTFMMSRPPQCTDILSRARILDTYTKKPRPHCSTTIFLLPPVPHLAKAYPVIQPFHLADINFPTVIGFVQAIFIICHRDRRAFVILNHA